MKRPEKEDYYVMNEKIGKMLLPSYYDELEKYVDYLEHQDVSEEDIELELRRSYDVSHPSDTNKAIGFVHGIHWLTKKLKGNK